MRRQKCGRCARGVQTLIMKPESPDATSFEMHPVATPNAPEANPSNTSKMEETPPQMALDMAWAKEQR